MIGRSDGPSLRPHAGTLLFMTVLSVSGCGSETRMRAQFVDAPLWTADRLAQPSGRSFRTPLGQVAWKVTSDPTASRTEAGLVYPYLVAADERQVYVVEADQVIVAFNQDGHEVWRYGRKGGGPGEFQRIRDIRVWPHHGILVTDGALRRLSLVDTGGKLVWEAPLRGMGTPEAAVPASDSSIVLLTAGPGFDTMRILGRDAERIGSIHHPWPGMSRVAYLAAQYTIAGPNQDGQWVQLFVFGDGWFPFVGDHSTGTLGGYVEHTEFPAVTVSGDKRSQTTNMVRAPSSGISGGLTRDQVVILFGGTSNDQGRVLDYYSFGDGRYAYSRLMPTKAIAIAISGSRLFALSLDSIPSLTAYVITDS